ncbi:hypothetical protein [Arthrobacter sp. B0490]|uniref:hypothetical protein n=1 Tax=Arthrobacter sp. B0490 TaxID=2058891 RepID=UPI000CE52F49|nr:hypothetical protein [Arthrobacter sp. B0490]
MLLIPVVLLTIIILSLWQFLRATPEPRWGFVFLSDFFNLDREVNIPTWFTAALWLAVAAMAAVLALRASSHRRSWWLFSLVSLVFSIDESTSLHERLNPAGAVLAQRFDIGLRFAWVIPGSVIALVLVLLLLRLVLSLPVKARIGVIIAGCLFLGGALVGEIFSDLSLQGTSLLEVPNSPTYIAFNAVEELLEMAGVALCLASLASLVRWQQEQHETRWMVSFDEPQPQGALEGSDPA